LDANRISPVQKTPPKRKREVVHKRKQIARFNAGARPKAKQRKPKSLK